MILKYCEISYKRTHYNILTYKQRDLIGSEKTCKGYVYKENKYT